MILILGLIMTNKAVTINTESPPYHPLIGWKLESRIAIQVVKECVGICRRNQTNPMSYNLNFRLDHFPYFGQSNLPPILTHNFLIRLLLPL
ncbi:hypothetical protein ES288_D08G061600v1 [Gossypium darwinii]|uniref:Uncharacterized protein n=1 Tax=Gossypium darwinii TaxID=34276 RepID=A0A5D2BIM5_GOSDA|nr:hypothetical protein ES288_D08G061600v1 [Gossypium darwinii]